MYWAERAALVRVSVSSWAAWADWPQTAAGNNCCKNSHSISTRSQFPSRVPNVEDVKREFHDTIYSDIHETRFEDTKVTCAAKAGVRGSILLLLEIDYLLVCPGEARMKIDKTNLFTF